MRATGTAKKRNTKVNERPKPGVRSPRLSDAIDQTDAYAALDERTAAKMIGCCTRTLRNMRDRGAIKYVKVGRSVRYLRKHIEAYLNENERGGWANTEAMR